MAQWFVLRWSETGKQGVPRTFAEPEPALELARAMARLARKRIEVVDNGGNLFRSIRVSPNGELIESAGEAAAVGAHATQDA